jgi:hypothetical protein
MIHRRTVLGAVAAATALSARAQAPAPDTARIVVGFRLAAQRTLPAVCSQSACAGATRQTSSLRTGRALPVGSQWSW